MCCMSSFVCGFFCVKGGRVKGKNNIRNFPTKHLWPVNAIGRKKQTQNIESDIDLEYEKDSAGKIIKWLKLVTILESIFGVVGVGFLLAVSYKAGKIWSFLDTYGDLIHGLWVLLPFELCGGIYGAYKNKKILRQVVIFVFVATLFLPMPISALKWGKIPVDKPEESSTLGEPLATPYPVEVSGAEVRYSMPYLRDEDIFVEELELYCGVEKGSIAEGEEAKKRADILEKDIYASRKRREGKTKPPLFSANWEVADHEFRVFESQQKILEEEIHKDETLSENKYFINEARKQRIDELETAKYYRIEADNQYEDAENQKLLAQYCISLCDEYLRDYEYNSSQESFDLALDNLQEGAEWAVKSMYNAAVVGDKDKIWKGMAELDKAVEGGR